MSTEREKDAETGTDTTGHEWDGIKELDTPLPRWWLWTFYATVVWGLAYTIAFPAWPLISQATAGVLGYSSRGELEKTIAAHEAANADMLARVADASFEEIRSDPEMSAFAFSGGAAVFRTNCSQCHGAGAAGAKGYPNLLDDDWLWGGTHAEIHETLRSGIRWAEAEDTRFSQMPAFGDDRILTRQQIELVSGYVLALAGGADAGHPGAQIFADNCAACHGDTGQGDRAMGAPNLADAIWLYGGEQDDVVDVVTHARFGVMPAWGHRLSEAEMKQVAHYVHSLGGGE